MLLEKILLVEMAVLLAGTIFAWYQWVKVFKQSKTCQPCAPESHPDSNCHACFNVEKPFKSKCFYGAVFFTLALILNTWAYYDFTHTYLIYNSLKQCF